MKKLIEIWQNTFLKYFDINQNGKLDRFELFILLTNNRKLFKLDEYQLYKSNIDPMSTYPNFLYSEYPSYITKLLSCVICLCFWTSLFSIVTLLYTLNYPLYYTIIMMPINYICSLLLYLLINKLL